MGELSVDQGNMNLPLRVRGGLDQRRCSIGLFRPGPEATYNGKRVDATKLLYFMPSRELDGHHQAGHGWTTLIIPDEWMHTMARAARAADSLRLPSDCRVLRPEPAGLADLQRAADAVIEGPPDRDDSYRGDDWLVSHLRNALGAVLSAFDDPSGKEARHTLAHFSLARRAERYMRERLDEPFCVDDLCIALRVSRRYLEYAFGDAFGTSPARYLRLLRLHEVRRRLKNADAETTVTGEALRAGFNHLGLFSVQYKKTFGETPSATLVAGVGAGAASRSDTDRARF